MKFVNFFSICTKFGPNLAVLAAAVVCYGRDGNCLTLCHIVAAHVQGRAHRLFKKAYKEKKMKTTVSNSFLINWFNFIRNARY